MVGASRSRKGGARVPVSKMPLLVIDKISIEQSPRAADKTRGNADSSPPAPAIAAAADADAADGTGRGGEGFSLVRRQLEALNAESGMLRRAVEDLRAEVGSRRAAVSTAGAPDTWRTPPAPPQPAQPYHYSSPVKPDRRGSGKDMAAAENATKPSSDELGDELKRALEARLR